MVACLWRVTCCVTAQGDPRKYATYLATRPKSYEAEAVALLIDVLRRTKDQPTEPGFRLHIVHLANADLLKVLKQARAEGRMLVGLSTPAASQVALCCCTS